LDRYNHYVAGGIERQAGHPEFKVRILLKLHGRKTTATDPNSNPTLILTQALC